MGTWLYPPLCTLCDAPGHDGLDICEGCLADLPFNRHACLRCALPLPKETQLPALCGGCLKRRRVPAYNQVWAPLVYSDTVAWLIGQLKFSGQLSHARLLASIMWQQLEDPLNRLSDSRPDVIVPVPLHGKRLRERGFNQALELARPISTASGIPLHAGILTRTRATEKQTELDPVARRRNVRNAFSCRTSLEDRHVALIDDVMTTGNTVEAAALALKKAGASRLSVWVAARTPRVG